MRRAVLLVIAIGCGGGGRVGEDLDTDRRQTPRPAARCQTNCQSADWVDREVTAALADIAVCLEEPAYAPPGLRGAITIAFRDLPCRQAVAEVAAAAGLRMVVSTVAGRRAVLLRHSASPGEKLVLLPRGDGWQPGGLAGGGAGNGPGIDTTNASRGCLDRCGVEVRACMDRCYWNDNLCVRSCQERQRNCSAAC